jgi:dipeptidyl-peptidase-4
MIRLAIVFLLLELTLPRLFADPPTNASVPALSIDTIYHPKNRFKYVDSPSPLSRWITTPDGSSLLLIRREKGWMQIDPKAKRGDDVETETIWPGTDVLVAQLTSLGDIDDKKARTVVSGWIMSDRSLDMTLLNIDGSIAIAGFKQKPRWITRQSTPWNDATLSPDGKRIAFVQDYDLHVMNVETGRMMRLTDDGSPTRLNGRLDWVYQEEVYGRGNFKAFWWSEDSQSLAFLRIDSSQVRPFTFTTSEGPRGGSVVERYPKAGDPNPSAELWVATLGQTPADVASLKPVFTPSSSGNDKESLIVRVGWRPGTQELDFVQTNRVQNELTLWRYDVSGNKPPSAIIKESSDQWLEILGLPNWLPDGDFLWLSDLPSGRRRVWRISEDGSRRVPLTPENFDVRELIAVDKDNSIGWVTGDQRRGTVGQHLYRISLSSSGQGDEMLRQVTDDLPWHVVSLSDDHRWMVDRASSLTRPTMMSLVELEPTSPQSTALSHKPTDQDSHEIAQPLRLHSETLRFPGNPIQPIWATVKTPDGLELPGYVFPPAAEEHAKSKKDSDAKKFPVLIEVYGGPLAPTVRDSWSSSRYLFHQFLAAEGIGVMVVDNRSSGGRGLADAWSIHRRVGELETKDMVAATQWLKTQSWVDGERIGIRGWSFGGFLTLHAMTNSKAFSVGVAGGSVTDWRNYDSIYTERFMGLPSDNQSGYESTSPLKKAEHLHGRVLLLHGEVDDNVHLANTLQMAEALQNAGKTFDMMIYPGSAHGIRPGMPTYHLMATTWEFLKRELK